MKFSGLLMKKTTKVLTLIVVIVVFVALMFIGLKGWNNFVVPNINKLNEFSLPLLLVFSFLAGVVSFFSPCAFALFPGYIAFYLGSKKENGDHPLILGAMASLGVITFFILLSAIIIFIGRGITSYLRYVTPAIGFLLIIFGLALFSSYVFKPSLIHTLLNKIKTKETRSKRNIYLFGVGYGAVSLGCTLPLLFALIIVPITLGKVFIVFLSLLVYALAMSLLMMGVTYLVSWSEHNIIKKMIKSTGTIKKISGLVLIIIGAYLVYYNVFYSML